MAEPIAEDPGGETGIRIDPIVQLDFDEMGGDVAVPLSQLPEWLENDLGQWGWLGEIKAPPSAVDLAQKLRSKIKTLRAEIKSHLAGLQPSPLSERIDRIARLIQESYVLARIPIRPHPFALFVQGIALTNKHAAAAALGHFTRTPFDLNEPDAFQGAFEALAFLRGLSGIPAEKQQAADNYIRQIQRTLAEIQALHDDERIEAETQQRVRGVENDQLLHVREEAKHSVHNLLLNSEKRFNELAEAYDAKLGLEAPVTYWAKKRKHHREKAIWAGIAVFSWLSAGTYGLSVIGSNLLNIEAKNAASLPFWHLATFGIALGLFVWIARIVVRIMMSHQHLDADAHERVVIAYTFLALLRKGHLKESETFKDLLRALLRHSPDGIVKDDALPLITDLLKNRLSS